MLVYLQSFKKFIPLLKELVSRDIKIKYRRSILGILWSLLNPLLTMFVITLVFSTLFKFDIPNFPVYYLTGSVIFGFFSEATTGSMSAIIGSAALIKKVYIPKYIFVLQKVAFSFVNLLYSLIAVIIVMVATDSTFYWTIILMPYALLTTAIFSVGVGLILATLATFFRDIIHLYSVFLTALIYFTHILYPVSILPPYMQQAIKFNPIYHFINYFRETVIYGMVPNLADHIYCMLFAVVSLIIGLVVFKRNQDKFILYI